MIPMLPTNGYELYALGLAGLWLAFGIARRFRERSAQALLQRAEASGSAEPTSLHPLIDPALCVGCGACASACPEKNVVGMIAGKAQLLDPGACIGHGACKTACPVNAIDLVFGTARRGVDIPIVSPSFESNVPGVYIAGELGGMGLIANAIEQGRQAIEVIAKTVGTPLPGLQDVVIVGGGPAGIAASLAAKQNGLQFLTFEQDTIGGTVAHYPRSKIVMTRPAVLPLYGRVRLRRVRKERLLALWKTVIGATDLTIHHGVRVDGLARLEHGFEVATSAGRVRTRTVLLATGRRGAPRKLGVAGEDLAKVVYRLGEAATFEGLHVLVVGGGDSALEAASMLARRSSGSVTLAYRGTAFDRAAPTQRQAIARLEREGRVHVLRSAQVQRIDPRSVTVALPARTVKIANDSVIICVGGSLPMELLEDIGIRVERKFGTA